MSRSRSSTGASAASTNITTIGFMPTALRRQPSVLSRATVTGMVSAPTVAEQHAPPHALKRALTCPTRGSKPDTRTGRQRTVSNPAPTSSHCKFLLPTFESGKPNMSSRRRRSPTPYPSARSSPHTLSLPGAKVHETLLVDVHAADEYDGFADGEDEDLPEPTIDITIRHARLPSEETGYFDAKTHINPANAYYSYAFAQEVSSDEHSSQSSNMRRDSGPLPSLSCDDTTPDNSDLEVYGDDPRQSVSEANQSVHSSQLSPSSPHLDGSRMDKKVQTRRPSWKTSELDNVPASPPLRLDPSDIATHKKTIDHAVERFHIPTLAYNTRIEVFADGFRSLIISTISPANGIVAGHGDQSGTAPSHTPSESVLKSNENFWLANNHYKHKPDPLKLCTRLQILADRIEAVGVKDGTDMSVRLG